MISQNDEKEILSQLREGSEQAFEKIYRAYSTRLYGNLLKLVKLTPEAQEMLQDVFMKIWVNRKNINTEKSFRSYLFKIAENQVYDFFRKAARDKRKEAQLIALATNDDMAVDELLQAAEKSVFLEKAIGSLPPQRQQVFRLCKLEGKSYQQVSELLGISVSTISDHIVKATKAIRSYVASNHYALLLVSTFSFWNG